MEGVIGDVGHEENNSFGFMRSDRAESTKVRGIEKHRPGTDPAASIGRPLSAGTIIDQGRYYAAIGALRRPRAALIPRLPPTRLLSGLTSFWPDCRRDFSSAFARRFEFLFAIQQRI